jgi:hypothetical protein
MSEPFTTRWLRRVLDDPGLSHRARSAAVPIWKHADGYTGFNCHVSIPAAAAEMGVSRATMKRGWAELIEAGYLTSAGRKSAAPGRKGADRQPVLPRTAPREPDDQQSNGSQGASSNGSERATTKAPERSGFTSPPGSDVETGKRCACGNALHPGDDKCIDCIVKWARDNSPTHTPRPRSKHDRPHT